MSLTDNQDISKSPRLFLALRFTRFLDRIDRAAREPTRRENYHLGRFVEFLASERWLDAVEALRHAEQAEPIPPEAAALTATNTIRPTTLFRRLLLETVPGD